jgi:hypothetical protein
MQAFDIHSPENPSILAVNYYPPMTDEEVHKKQPPRLHAHADMDVLTILYQRAGKPRMLTTSFTHAWSALCKCSSAGTSNVPHFSAVLCFLVQHVMSCKST